MNRFHACAVAYEEAERNNIMADTIPVSRKQDFEDFETFCRYVDDKNIGWKTELGSGSIAELMPFFNAYKRAELDIDILLYVDHIVAVHGTTGDIDVIDEVSDVASKSDLSESQLEKVVVHSRDTQTGYVKLYRPSTGTYLTISELNRKGSRLTQYEKIKLGGRGPASKSQLPAFAMGQKSPMVLTGFDNVHFVRCMEWPSLADEWTTRMRPSGWPSQSLVKRCMELGCLFVPASHVSSGSDREREFRYSFSFPELLLVRSWSPLQKFVYNTLKQLKNKVRKRLQDANVVPEGTEMYLQSYHVKTVLFWACEERPTDFWNEDSAGTVLTKLADDVIKRLVTRECRHYFIRDINLFDLFAVDDAMVKLIADGIRDEVKKLGFTAFRFYLSSTVRLTTALPDMVIKWLQLCNIDPTITSKASMFELYDLYLALKFQKLELANQQNGESIAKGEGSAAERHFRRAAKKGYAHVKKLDVAFSSWEDVVTTAGRVAYWDKSFEDLMFPLTQRSDNSYPAFLARKLNDKQDDIDEFSRQKEQREGKGKSLMGSIKTVIITTVTTLYKAFMQYDTFDWDTFDWDTFAEAALPQRQSFFGARAYYANYNYMLSTKAGFERAIELCDEAMKLHAEFEQAEQAEHQKREFKLLWYYEVSYAVALCKQWSTVYDVFVRSMIDRADEKSLPILICPFSFMYYVKVRCLQRLNASRDVVSSALIEWHKHMQHDDHTKFYPLSTVFEKQLYEDVAWSNGSIYLTCYYLLRLAF